MYKVMIIEDERRIREGLKILIDWESIGFQVEGECDNGVDAVKAVLRKPYDVLLCDIRLPGKNGLDMLRELRGQGIDCPAVMISGYAEFEYAKAAIECNVKKYLLKPINEKELTETLLAIKEELDGKTEHGQPAPSELEASIVKYIEKNYAQNVSIKKMSEELGYNSCYIGRAFAQRTGMSMKDYLYTVRIKKASRLLMEDRMKIQDIAFEVGFRDLNKFYQEFKRIKGATPKEFLSNLKKE